MACVQCGGTITVAQCRGVERDYYEHEDDMLNQGAVAYDNWIKEQDAEAEEITNILRNEWLDSDLTLDEWKAQYVETVCYCDDDGVTVVYPDGYIVADSPYDNWNYIDVDTMYNIT